MKKETLYSYSDLQRDIGTGSRKTWKNIINHEDYKHLFSIGGSNYGRDLYSTRLTKKELKNIIIEYKKKVQYSSLILATKARMDMLHLT